MTPEQVHLIRKSFIHLSAQDHVAALVFYRHLFTLDPSLRPMFKGDIEEQARKLIDMLAALISMLERPAGLDIELRAMGSRHLDYGVTEAHYATVGTAMLNMLSDVLGKQFTPPTRAAWEALYDAVAQTMKRGAQQAIQAKSQS